MPTSANKVIAGSAYVVIEAIDRSKKALRNIHASLRSLKRHIPTLRKLSRMIGQVTKKIRRLGIHMMQTGRSMMARGAGLGAGFAALAYPIMRAISTAKQFRNEMNALNAVLDLSGIRAEKLETLVRNLGRTTSFTATQVAMAGQELARGGFSSREVENSLESVLAMARSGKVDLTTASKSMVRSIRAFGLDAADSVEVADQFFQASREGTATVEELAMSLSFTAGTADRMGMSLSETLGILSKMANQMLHGTKGGTSLNQMLLRMGTRAQQVAKKMDVDVFDQFGQPRQIVPLLNDLSDAMGKMTIQAQLKVMESIFNVRGSRAAAAALKNFRGVADAIERIKKSSGEAEKAQKNMNKGIVGSVNKLMSAMQEMIISLGDLFQEPLKAAENYLIPILNDLSDFFNKNAQLGWKIVKVLAAMAGTAAGMVALGAAITAAGVALATFMTVLTTLATPIGASIVAGLAGAFLGLRPYMKSAWEDFFGFAEGSYERIVKLFKRGRIKEAFKATTDLIKPMWDTLILEMKLAWTQFIQDVRLTLLTTATNMQSRILNMAQNINSIMRDWVPSYDKGTTDMNIGEQMKFNWHKWSGLLARGTGNMMGGIAGAVNPGGEGNALTKWFQDIGKRNLSLADLEAQRMGREHGETTKFGQAVEDAINEQLEYLKGIQKNTETDMAEEIADLKEQLKEQKEETKKQADKTLTEAEHITWDPDYSRYRDWRRDEKEREKAAKEKDKPIPPYLLEQTVSQWSKGGRALRGKAAGTMAAQEQFLANKAATSIAKNTLETAIQTKKMNDKMTELIEREGEIIDEPEEKLILSGMGVA